MFHQDPTIFGCFSEGLVLVWFVMALHGLVRFGFSVGLVGYGLV